jgi:amino acid adenylation domain-containing protein
MSNLHQQIASLTPEQRALFEQRLQQRGLSLPQSGTIPVRSRSTDLPLSFAQQRLWFIQQLDPDSVVYNVPCVLRLRGQLDVQALERSLNEIIRRHEILRTTFHTNGQRQPIQSIQPYQALMLDVEKITEENLEQIAKAEANQPFNLTEALLRLRLLQFAPYDYALLITTHHIISDRWSVGVFLRELSILYQSFTKQKASPLPELPIQYADWAIWQRQQLQGNALSNQQEYWKQQLNGELPILNLPTDFSRSAVSNYQGAQLPIQIPQSLSDALKAIAAQEGVTLFMLLLASFQTLLYRYTEQADLLVGTDIVNRDRQETEGLIGLFVNTLVLRTNLSGNPSFRELLSRVREVTLEAYTHQHLPFEQLVEMLNPERDLSQMIPLFQVKLDLQLATVTPPVLTDLELERLFLEDSTVKYELRLNLQDSPAGISGQFEYRSDLFTQDTIARLSQHWQTLLEGIVDNLDQKLTDLPLLSAIEIQQFEAWNQAASKYPTDLCIHDLVSAQANRSPDAIALISGTEPLTYEALETKSNQLANYLQDLGVEPETPVGICIERSIEMAIAILGVLKAGGTYVPLDPSYPTARLNWIVADAQVRILLTQDTLLNHLSVSPDIKVVQSGQEAIAQYRSDYPKISATSKNLAYLIYTSGSTGTPKGVEIAHQSTVNLLYWARDVFSGGELAGVLASTSICFDLSIFELFVPLSWGGTAILAENALALPNLPAKEQITLINTVPSAIAQLLQHNAIPPSVKTINLAGEPFDDRLLQQLKQLPQAPKIYNLYGPSEATTYSTYAELTVKVSIGCAIANTQLYVLDQSLNPVPIGVPGELYIAGSGLAQGYRNRPELTAERFIQLQGKTAYRTGDRVCWQMDGTLKFLGRWDAQVKLRGYRIELGEIESVLNNASEVEKSVVLLRGDELVAYVISTLETAQIRAFLSDRLPSYMIPSRLICLDTFPLNSNGKIDRKALLDQQSTEVKVGNVAPRNSLEETLAQIWCKALNLTTVSIHDNFFELGGHSLLGIQVIAEISTILKVEVPLRKLFQHSTIAQLAENLPTDQLSEGSSLSQIQIDSESRYLPFPLTDIQQAYLIGRNAVFELGNISTHGYREIETVGLSIEQVEHAFSKLIERHDMLRVVVQTDGSQRILPQVPPYKMNVLDLRTHAPEFVEQQLGELRDRLSHQILSTDQYPLFEIQAVQLDETRIRFCASFDVLIGDAWSFQILGRELALLLQHPEQSIPPLTLSFRDYVLAERDLKKTEQYQRSLNYWTSRIETLPPAPELPLSKAIREITSPQFSRRTYTLEPSLWQSLKQQATKARITPSGLLLAAFSEILARWSRRAHFTLNLTLFNRLPLHPEVNELIGDFTASSLLEVDYCNSDSFIDRARQVQAQLWSDLDHRYISGVEVLRLLARQQQRLTGAVMPIVFTSTLNQATSEVSATRPWQTETVYSLSQTSQVYFDHQVSEFDGALVFNWDTIDELFAEGLLDDMFSAYCQFLSNLATDETLWYQSQQRLLPTYQLEYLAQFNSTQTQISTTLLHRLFFEQVARQPEAIAIFASEQSFTYQELCDRVCSLSHHLKQLGTQPEKLIAIVMKKGWEQVVAVLAVLTAGAAYVPIDPDLPSERRAYLLESTNASIVLTQSEFMQIFDSDLACIAVDTFPMVQSEIPALVQHPSDLAYVIYTSGSTGLPKGVMITHQAAVNTILDVNQRFQVNNCDRVFALSSLSFDLSVYDIFGTLAAGAAIVLPDADKLHDRTHWSALLAKHSITIWDSVPALMQLLIGEVSSSCESLRLILLSGDWIPLNLPHQIQTTFSKAKLISLGGATEAAIWSIYYPVEAVAPHWKSIPYGRPLANQQIYVLNDALQPCPIEVPGQLYIGGAGLMQGYWHDPEKTLAALVPNPLKEKTRSEFLYKTGDIGRYQSDGTIEFLGREDSQIKLNGYRIELGEIETALQQHPAIQQAVVSMVGEIGFQQLVAYVVPTSQAAGSVARLDFKQQNRNLRVVQEQSTIIKLPKAHLEEINFKRQSYRQFLSEPMTLQALSQLLSEVRSRQVESLPVPKYRYASAGSLYPVQTYLYVQPGRITGIDSGIYYYHPHHHELIQIHQGAAIDSSIYGINQTVVEQSAFSIFLIGQLDAIEPIYGDRARDFCLLEAGYMSQLFMETAPQYEIGLCPIGDLDFESVRTFFDLEPSHILLHTLAGGGIDPQWSTQWQLSPQANTKDWMIQKLQEFLQQRLPSYMVPKTYCVLDSFPLTTNGKIDRRALPTPEQAQAARKPFIAPETEIECAIAKIWQSTLNQEQIGTQDNFFELGGNSLTVLQAIGQLRQTLNLELSVQNFFAHPTIAEQATLLQSQSPQASALDSIQPVKRTAPDQAILEDLDQLSEEEIEVLLNQLSEVES